MKTREQELNEFINMETMTPISGDEPVNNSMYVKSNMTTDKAQAQHSAKHNTPYITTPSALYTGLGYFLEENEDLTNEQFIDKRKAEKVLNALDLIKRRDDDEDNEIQFNGKVPNIYDIKSNDLSLCLKNMIGLLRSENNKKYNANDKFVILSEVLDNIDLSDLDMNLKKVLKQKISDKMEF